MANPQLLRPGQFVQLETLMPSPPRRILAVSPKGNNKVELELEPLSLMTCDRKAKPVLVADGDDD